MRLLLLLFRESRSILLLSILASVIAGACNTLLLGLLSKTVNQAREGHVLGAQQNLGPVWVFFGIAVTIPLARAFSDFILIRLGQRTILNLRMKLGESLLGVPLRRLEELGAPRILSTLTQDIPTITSTITFVPVLCFNLAIVITCLIYLLIESAAAFAVLVILVSIGIFSYQFPILKANRLFKAVRETHDELYRHFETLTLGVKELKLHRDRRRAFLDRCLHEGSDRFAQQSTEAMSIYAIAGTWAVFMIFFIIGLQVFVLPTLLPSITRETLISYVLVFLYMVSPLQMVLSALPNLNRSQVALRRIDRLGLSFEEAVAEPIDDGAAPAASWEALELSGVTHRYWREGEEKSFALGPIDLRLQPGEIVFVIGGNGSGKTSLVKLLSGLYGPEEGVLRLDGQPLTVATAGAYRELFSVVFSDFHLFENLLGLDAPDLDERARAYLSQLELERSVSIEDGRLSTTQLSRGQRKRLALLTAYMEDRPIYIFDEWAADQDPVFKKIFYEELLPELKARGKTMVVVSHDDTYYHVADRIIKLDYGRIVSDERRDATRQAPPSP